MRFTRTDDPIKGIGFVAIYFANLEDALDALIRCSGCLFAVPPNIGRRGFRDRAEWLQKEFRVAFDTCTYPSSDEESVRVDEILKACRAAALTRNEVVHSPIIGDGRGGAVRRTRAGAMCRLDVTRVYRFAEDLTALVGEVLWLRFVIEKVRRARQAAASREASDAARRP